MDSFTLNKIAGAVLGTCLIGMGIGIVGQAIYSPTLPKKPGYALPEPKETAGGAKAPGKVPLPVLLAKADPKKGEADAKICGACHNFAEGAGAKVGPDLYGVVGREKGSQPGFEYSAGMKKKGGKWTFEDLNAFITKPSAYVQGTKMGFGGEESPEKRADIIAWLRTLSKNPEPLPKVTEADKKMAEGGEGAPAAGGGQASGESFVQMVAAADPKKGEAATKICHACHNFKKGEGAKVGPDLYGVVDREKGSKQGFDYSAAMKKKGGKWTYDDLNQFLTKPSAYVQGTKMGFGGEDNEKKRAEIVAYLRSNADAPAPLPAGGEKKAGGGEQKQATAEPGKPTEGGAPAAGGDDGFIKLVAAADPKQGKSAAQICSACHNFQKGAGTLVGPDLWGVVDRPKGSEQGFNYSAGMKAKGGKWTYADLNQFLTKPQAYVQGTKMGFGGEANEKKRASIVAFLRTLADTPAPLPGAAGDKPKAEPTADKGGDQGAKPDAKTDAKGDQGARPDQAAKPDEGGKPAPPSSPAPKTENKSESAPPPPTPAKPGEGK